MIYPTDAITIPFCIAGQESIILLPATTTPRTILNVHIIANPENEGSFIDCGDFLTGPFIRLAKIKTLGYDNRLMTFLCSDKIMAGSTGPKNVYGQIVYVNYDLNESISGNPKTILIQNDETGAEFYLDKTLNYGEAMILWFLTLFAFYLIFRTAYNFFWKK